MQRKVILELPWDIFQSDIIYDSELLFSGGRWLNCLDPSLNQKAWTEEEDAKLLAAIAEQGYCWSKVATCVPPRTDSQCRR